MVKTISIITIDYIIKTLSAQEASKANWGGGELNTSNDINKQ